MHSVKRRLRDWDGHDIVEMESYWVGRVAAASGLPFLAVRAVSDGADATVPDIPGLMKAMTMTFDVAPEVALEGLEPGAEVDFQVKYEGGAYVVTELRRSGS